MLDDDVPNSAVDLINKDRVSKVDGKRNSIHLHSLTHSFTFSSSKNLFASSE